ncbi:MAG: prephenate dehydrogenase [Firmicutes bacterium]|nr:prephenate dehydrogenase [Bacillota bacterium]
MNYEKDFTVGIVGLGLMGASLAMALEGFKDARVVGTDIDPVICRRAMCDGAVSEAYIDPARVFEQAGLLIFCVYAHHIPALLEANAKHLKPGCVVSDICGVKGPLYEKIMPLVPQGASYVGAHPMAGKELDGYENAEAGLYRGCGFVIVPTERSTPGGAALLRELAEYIGAARVALAEPEEHDALIAYTSDLMHIAAAGLCVRPHPGFGPAFAAGAFRDSTRVADINAGAWTELLMDNRGNTAQALGRYIEDLQAVKAALVNGDREALYELLREAGENKRRMKSM